MPDLANLNFDKAVKVKVLNVETALSAALYPTSGNFIDVSDLDKFVFFIPVGALNSALAPQVQQATAVNGTPKDITGATVAIAATDDNKWASIEVDVRALDINNGYRYVTLNMVGPSGGDDYGAIIFLGYAVGYQPVTQPTGQLSSVVVTS